MKKKLIQKKKIITWSRIINGLTISRIILGLPIIFALKSGNNEIFIYLILIGILSDFFDGYFARKYDQQTVLGAKLDPLADKILLLGPMIWLVQEDLVPLWAIWLLISRELLITSWRSNKISGGPASFQGKLKTSLQFISIILLLWPENWGNDYTINVLNKIGYISFWICLFLTYSSAIRYVFNQKENHQY
tara:strand:- start:902 stop:1474 length:573 start_codon:yes stop_codon:yes gene_type:complete